MGTPRGGAWEEDQHTFLPPSLRAVQLAHTWQCHWALGIAVHHWVAGGWGQVCRACVAGMGQVSVVGRHAGGRGVAGVVARWWAVTGHVCVGVAHVPLSVTGLWGGGGGGGGGVGGWGQGALIRYKYITVHFLHRARLPPLEDMRERPTTPLLAIIEGHHHDRLPPPNTMPPH